jgi:hypothetical protein
VAVHVVRAIDGRVALDGDPSCALMVGWYIGRIAPNSPLLPQIEGRFAHAHLPTDIADRRASLDLAPCMRDLLRHSDCRSEQVVLTLKRI